MKFDRDTVLHVEKLARIDLTDEERDRLTDQLIRIVEYCEKLQDVDTEGIEPTSGVVIDGGSKLRDDEVGPSLDRDVVLGMAPDKKGPYFRVPKIIGRSQS